MEICKRFPTSHVLDISCSIFDWCVCFVDNCLFVLIFLFDITLSVLFRLMNLCFLITSLVSLNFENDRKLWDKWFLFSSFTCVKNSLKTRPCQSARTSREVVIHSLFVPIESLIVPWSSRCQILSLLCVVYISSLSAISYNIGYHWDRTGNDENGYPSA
jgi:hypothetical protein